MSKHKDKANKVTACIEEFKSELRTLLSLHCESKELVNALLPIGNKFPIDDYLSARYRNELGIDTVFNCATLSLKEIDEFVSKLTKFKVIVDFVPTIANRKSPQMTLRQAIPTAYTIITKTEFTTF